MRKVVAWIILSPVVVLVAMAAVVTTPFWLLGWAYGVVTGQEDLPDSLDNDPWM